MGKDRGKKIVALLLALCIAGMGLVGCGSGKPGEPEVVEPPFEDAELGMTVYPVGNSATFGDWDLKLTNAYLAETVEDNTYYYEPSTGDIFVVAGFEITNKGAEAATLLQYPVALDGTELFIMPVGEDIYSTPERLSTYPYDLYGKSVEPGETVSGVFIFQVPTEDSEKDWNLVFTNYGAMTDIPSEEEAEPLEVVFRL
ncbi:MAG: DUF4352 domain-containing protein [Coriobacteriales bacterium]|jgi:hypothetical protein|nr:DUF4352 domain-containing protein [Coriobacteriales bacterium]